jgi:uracil-DNA glycosylase
MLTLSIRKEVVDQTWSVENIAREYAPPSWRHVFEAARNELSDVSDILAEQESVYGPYYPLKQDLFTAFHKTPLQNVKVVIMGMDPYPQGVIVNGVNVPRAVGVSFGTRQGDAIPSSLANIYKELANSVHGFQIPDHGDLSEWMCQGVLMLNACLTVRPGIPGSHGDIWLGFIKRVCTAISLVNPHCIYLLWGQQAQKLKPMLGERSVVFEAAHPSGQSARRGFFGCNHFNLVNQTLISQGHVGINWRISPMRLLAERTPVQMPPVTMPDLLPVSVSDLPSIPPLKRKHNDLPQIPTVPLPIIPNTTTRTHANGDSPPPNMTFINEVPVISAIVR